MRILHILDHSLPLGSGYAFRTHSILEHQRRLSWYTAHVTGAKHYGARALEEDVDGHHFCGTSQTNGSVNQLIAVTGRKRVIAAAQLAKDDRGSTPSVQRYARVYDRLIPAPWRRVAKPYRRLRQPLGKTPR